MTDAEGEMAANTKFVSQAWAEVVGLIGRDGDAFAACSSTKSSLDGEYAYAVNPWPLILSRDRVVEFERFISALPKLLHKAMKICFGETGSAFQEYLHEPEVLRELVCSSDGWPFRLLARHDVVYSSNALKLIEVNAGFSIGGWQMDWFEPAVRERLRTGFGERRWSLRYRSLVVSMLSLLIDEAARLRGPAQELSVLLFLPVQRLPHTPAMLDTLHSMFDMALESTGRRGRLQVFSDFEGISFDTDGRLSAAGKPVDAVALVGSDGSNVPRSFLVQLLRSQLAGRVASFDGALQMLVGNKALMSMLHEPAVQRELSTEELAFVATHIPWTAKLTHHTPVVENASASVFERLFTDKDSYVLKRCESAQGRDVIIGRFVSGLEWRGALEAHVDDPLWLAQEYCEPDEVLAPDALGEIGPHRVVLGIFDTGGSYGGCFARGVPSAGGNGVINSANGAHEMVVYEELPVTNRIVI